MGFENTFKVLANPIRREILSVLKGGKLSAEEICSRFIAIHKSNPTVGAVFSRSLCKILTQWDGKPVPYRFCPDIFMYRYNMTGAAVSYHLNILKS